MQIEISEEKAKEYYEHEKEFRPIPKDPPKEKVIVTDEKKKVGEK